MAIRPGDLRTRIIIRRKNTAPDGHGGRVTTWSDLATVYAEVISQNGREAVLAGTLQGVSAARVTIRYRGDVTTADQLRINGKDCNIRSAEDPDGRREALVLFVDTAAVEA